MSTTTTDSTGKSSIDQLVFRIAGVFIIASLALALLVSPHCLWFTAFVGINLTQFSFTGFCPLALVLKRLGYQPGAAFCCGE